MLMKEHNITTNEIIEREMNADELAQHEAYIAAEKAKAKAEAAEAAAKEAARQALLDKLGITADEAKLLLG